MQIIRREVWAYAILMMLLFTISSIAVFEAIDFIQDQSSPPSKLVVAAIIWSLTLGFMLISGSFGLWAIKFAGEAEARRRVGRLVDAMSYMNDGMLVIDEKGLVTGLNPASRKLLNREITKEEFIGDVFTCLDEADVAMLLDKYQANEVERNMSVGGIPKVFRFRSQPSEDLRIIIISDITASNVQRMRSRQSAKLQLIGEIARGVAHDFNNLLCGISGYAAILNKMQPGSPEMNKSISAIAQNVERGISLSGNLLQLSQKNKATKFTEQVTEHIESAVRMLRDSLPVGWKVESIVHSRIPLVALTGAQIEQIVNNLGIIVAEGCKEPAILRINSGVNESSGLINIGSNYAGAVIITVAKNTDERIITHSNIKQCSGESGVIQSVIRSMLEDSGGGLDCFTASGESQIFRIKLPHGNMVNPSEANEEVSEEIKVYLSNWNILLASSDSTGGRIYKLLNSFGIKAVNHDNLAALFGSLEHKANIDVIVIDSEILGEEVKALTRTVLKLKPNSGVVIICEDPDVFNKDIADVVFARDNVTDNELLVSLVESRSLASHRKK